MYDVAIPTTDAGFWNCTVTLDGKPFCHVTFQPTEAAAVARARIIADALNAKEDY